MTRVKTATRRLHRADRKLSAHATAQADRGPLPVRALDAVAELADQPPLIALSAATLALGLVLRRGAVAEAGARMLASHLLATGIKTVVKRTIDRTRPHSVESGREYRLETGDSASHHYSSFPSGHTAGAVAVARAAARVRPDATPLFATGAVAAGALQLPTGRHYASDVAAGAAIGLLSEWVVDRAIDAASAAISRRTAAATD